MLGVVQMLYVELGVLKYSMPVAGASTGSIVATCDPPSARGDPRAGTGARSGGIRCRSTLQRPVRRDAHPVTAAAAAAAAQGCERVGDCVAAAGHRRQHLRAVPRQRKL